MDYHSNLSRLECCFLWDFFCFCFTKISLQHRPVFTLFLTTFSLQVLFKLDSAQCSFVSFFLLSYAHRSTPCIHTHFWCLSVHFYNKMLPLINNINWISFLRYFLHKLKMTYLGQNYCHSAFKDVEVF